jgi:hypothetical protein
MKRTWAALLAATALVGCRSAQSTTNPFLRTTVPPPATAPAVVVPGEPFTPGVVTPAAPAAVVPMAPPPVVAPPMVAPPRDKFSPPGGSFQYNQSSIDRSKGAGAQAVQLASYSQPSGSASRDTVAREARAAPCATAPIAAATGTPGNMIRILPPRTEPSVVAVAATQEFKPSSSSNPLMRVTVEDGGQDADDGQADVADEDTESEGPEVRQVAAVAPRANWDATAQDEEAEESAPDESQPEAQTASTSGGNAGYAFSPDYGWLRGRLEYSQTVRQWKLRYIPIDGQTDQYGGSVKLPTSEALASFKPGDMVAVRGSLATEAAPTGSFAPLYVLAHIEPAVR